MNVLRRDSPIIKSSRITVKRRKPIFDRRPENNRLRQLLNLEAAGAIDNNDNHGDSSNPFEKELLHLYGTKEEKKF